MARAGISRFRGLHAPLVRKLVGRQKHVHAKTGLGRGRPAAPAKRCKTGHELDFHSSTPAHRTRRQRDAGAHRPLTNIAGPPCKRLPPTFARGLPASCCMGGAYSRLATFTPAAESTSMFDPEAAGRSSLPQAARCVVAPLDVTPGACHRPARRGLSRARTTVGRDRSTLDRFLCTFRQKRNTALPARHCTILVTCLALRPDLFTGREINVEIEVTGTHTLGMNRRDVARSRQARECAFSGRCRCRRVFALLTETVGRLM